MLLGFVKEEVVVELGINARQEAWMLGKKWDIDTEGGGEADGLTSIPSFHYLFLSN